jgi:hypothetical protein
MARLYAAGMSDQVTQAKYSSTLFSRRKRPEDSITVKSGGSSLPIRDRDPRLHRFELHEVSESVDALLNQARDITRTEVIN